MLLAAVLAHTASGSPCSAGYLRRSSDSWVDGMRLRVLDQWRTLGGKTKYRKQPLEQTRALVIAEDNNDIA
jgi:hypothetical protein